MTTPPLPASPCIRVRLIYTDADGALAGSRFYLSYAGSAPTAANCSTIGSDIASAWNTNMAPLVQQNYTLTEIDVLDIATLSGLSGQWIGTHQGGDTGAAIASQVAVNVEFDIARRYRGGKPRMFWPPASAAAKANDGNWSSSFVAEYNTGVAAFFTAVEAISVGAVGALAHVNLSFYKGFTNFTTPSGRERAVPQYRSTALLDTVTGYSTKARMGSQRRRRAATTP
jgi:hypothetical protein